MPFTAIPPTTAIDGPAPLVVTWHLLDAPRTDAAFAAAPQLPTATAVDEILTQWFGRQLGS